MVVEKIILRNYRNYDYLSLEFSPKLNIIVGANGAGKTNIVESIQYLSLARSFRTQESTDLIKKGCQFATIEARVVENTSKKDIVAILTVIHYVLHILKVKDAVKRYVRPTKHSAELMWS